MGRTAFGKVGVRPRALGRLSHVIIAMLLIALDQLFKGLALAYLSPGMPVPVRLPLEPLNGAVNLTLTFNKGAAFGLFWNKQPLFVALTILALVALSAAFVRSRPEARLYRMALTLVAAGAVGNLIDRLRYGYVVDYVDVGFWPVFNLADAILDIGAVLLVWTIVRPGSGQGRRGGL